MSTELTPEQRARLESIFDRALVLPAAEQTLFLDKECGPSGALREHAARLLAGLGGENLLGAIQAGPPSRAGTRIGPYELIERVGEGGMGEVYAADQREPVARRVALKIIKPGMDSAQVIARFEAERQALARMSHPNVAQVLDGGTTESGSPYFVMEFVPGTTITEYCDQHRLSTRARLELFLAVCEGVQHAHQKGIIHRDLKPSNILVIEQDGRALPKIIDFGLARAVTGRLVDRTLHTMMGQIVGTIDYMSPEQADPSSSDIDTRSDIYSLGVVLYQVLSGLLPFEYHLAADLPLSFIQRSIREKDPPTPSTRLRRERRTATRLAPLHGTDERSLVRQLTGDLDWICLKALEKEPARRYASASELAEDLRRHLRHEPVLAGRPGTIYRARKFVRRNRLGVTSATLLVLALASGAFGLFRQLAGARVEAAFSYASALQQVEAQVRRADELWPVTSDRIDDYERWIDGAQALRGPLEDYRAELVQLEARTNSGSGLSGADRQRHEWLTTLVDTLGSWDDEVRGLLAPRGVSPEHGWSVPRRLDLAREVQAREQDPRFAAQWQEARDAIHAEPRYDRLELGPQRGLLPLGPDPISRLHEFAVLGSGEPPRRDPKTRELVFEESSGIVLVLIPCGGFFMGTQHHSPDAPNYLAEPTFMESVRRSPSQRLPVDGIEPADVGTALWVPDLPAFFISKFEMTGAQWILANGPIPERDLTGAGVFARFPIDLVTALECDLALGRLGLVLPNEVQWERAARAGTTTPWWTGPDEGSLRGAENILDASSMAKFKAWGQGTRRTAAAWDDGEWGFGEVGRRDKRCANPFGLWDMLGNVTEWCSNAPFVLGNPLPGPEAARTERIARGGSSRLDPFFCRASGRGFMNNPDFRLPALGLRPAREIDI